MYYVAVAQYKYHWRCIVGLCKKANKKMLQGEKLSSAKMVRLAEKIDSHGVRAVWCEETIE